LKSCTHAVKALEPTGVPLDLAAKEYVAAWGLPGGSGLVVEAAREYAKRIPHRLPSKLVPDAVKEMLEAREKGEGASKTVLMPPRWLRTRWEVKLHPAPRAQSTWNEWRFSRELPKPRTDPFSIENQPSRR
jgi:hypothetical protein